MRALVLEAEIYGSGAEYGAVEIQRQDMRARRNAISDRERSIERIQRDRRCGIEYFRIRQRGGDYVAALKLVGGAEPGACAQILLGG